MQFTGWTYSAYLTSSVGGVRAVLSYLGSVIAFYIWALGPQIFMVLARLEGSCY